MKHVNEALLIEILAECTDMLLAGMPLAACLERYPEYAANLEPLLRTTAHVHALRGVPPRAPETVARSRAAFVIVARQMAAERARPAAPSLLDRLSAGWQQLLAGLAQSLGGLGTPRAMPVGLAAVLIVVMLTGLLATGAVTASAKALPGDFLYPVKMTAENVTVLMTRELTQRALLRQQFAERRVTEIQTVLGQGRVVRSIPIAGPLESFGAGTWQIAGLTVEVTSQTQIAGVPWVGAPVEGVVRAPGDGGLIAVYLEVSAPPPTPAPPKPTATSTSKPTFTPTPTATATNGPTPDFEPQLRQLVLEPIFEPLEIPTDTLTFTPTATDTPRPTVTATATRTSTPTPAGVSGRIFGWVNSIEPDYWLIDGNKVETNEATVIEGNPGLGWRVEAEVWILPDDRYIGLRIVALAGPDYVESFYTMEDISAKDGDVWTVGIFQIHIGPDTQIEGDPQIGDTVEVNGERGKYGIIGAKRITVVRSHRYDFLGEVQSINGSIWVVQGTTVHVTNQTNIIGNPNVGDWVGVSASVNSRSELYALLIYVAPR